MLQIFPRITGARHYTQYIIMQIGFYQLALCVFIDSSLFCDEKSWTAAHRDQSNVSNVSVQCWGKQNHTKAGGHDNTTGHTMPQSWPHISTHPSLSEFFCNSLENQRKSHRRQVTFCVFQTNVRLTATQRFNQMQNVSVTRETLFHHRVEEKQLYNRYHLSTPFGVAADLTEHKLLPITHLRENQRYINFTGNWTCINL